MYHLRFKGNHYEIGVKRGQIFKKCNIMFPLNMDDFQMNHGTKSEIDFVVNITSKKYYIQSALNLSDLSKMATELRPLKNTNDFFKKIIISKTSQKSWTDDDGILHLGLYQFLLNENSLDL